MRALKQPALIFRLAAFPVTTQAREGIETSVRTISDTPSPVTTQARDGIETRLLPALSFIADIVTTQAREGIETSSLCVCNISVM